MLVAASSARASPKASCHGFCKVRVSANLVERFSTPARIDRAPEKSAPYVTTDRNKRSKQKRSDRTDLSKTTGHTLFHAMAHRSLDGDWVRQRSLLLVSHGAFPPGRRGFPLGVAARALHVTAPKSIYHSARAVSPHRGFF